VWDCDGVVGNWLSYLDYLVKKYGEMSIMGLSRRDYADVTII